MAKHPVRSMGEGLQWATGKMALRLLSSALTAQGARLSRKSLPSSHPGGDARDLPGVVIPGRSRPAPAASTFVLLSASAGKMGVFHWPFLRLPMGLGQKAWEEPQGLKGGDLAGFPPSSVAGVPLWGTQQELLTLLPRLLWNCVPELLCPF